MKVGEYVVSRGARICSVKLNPKPFIAVVAIASCSAMPEPASVDAAQLARTGKPAPSTPPTGTVGPYVPPQAMIAAGRWSTVHDEQVATTCGTYAFTPAPFVTGFVDSVSFDLWPGDDHSGNYRCKISLDALMCDPTGLTLHMGSSEVQLTTFRQGKVLDRETVDAEVVYELECLSNCADIAMALPCQAAYDATFALLEATTGQ